MSPSYQISTIINYCSNDFRFLKRCIDAVKPFSSQIIVPVCDHFFNGSPENRSLLQHSFFENPDATFIEYAYSPHESYGLYKHIPEDPIHAVKWQHSTARYIGMQYVETDFVLFLDADEICDTEKFMSWLETGEYQKWNALRLFSCFYFREAQFRAKGLFEYVLLAQSSLMRDEILLTPYERKGVYHDIPDPKCEGLIQEPLFHHYSFVKPVEELLRKVETWGHRYDKPWKELLKRELSKPFRGRDLLFELNYETVEPYFDPLAISIPQKEPLKKESPHLRITPETFRRKNLERLFL